MGGAWRWLRRSLGGAGARLARGGAALRFSPWPRRAATAALIAATPATIAFGLWETERALDPMDAAVEAARLGGAQKAFSQNILYLATRIRTPDAEPHRWDDLAEAIARLEAAHAEMSLAVADAALTAEAPRRRRGEPQSVDTLVRDFIIDAQTVYDGGEPAASEAYARMARLGPDYLLTALDEAIGVYTARTEAAADHARLVARLAGAGALLVGAASAAALRRFGRGTGAAAARADATPAAADAVHADASLGGAVSARQALGVTARNDLTGALTMLELALDSEDDPDARRRLAMIRTACETFIASLPDLLDSTPAPASAMGAAFSPTALARRAQSAVAGLSALRDAAIYIEPAPGIAPRYLGDPERIRAVLVAILNYMVPGAGAESLQIRIEAAAGLLRFTVADPKSTLDPAVARGLLEAERPNATCVAPLTQAAHLAARLGGAIAATGAQGSGLAMAFEVPATAAEEGPQSQPPAGAHGMKLLVVDAAPVNRRAAVLALELTGAVVVESASAEAAFEALAAGDVAAALVDMEAPRFDGAPLVAAIRSADAPWARVPVLALTSDLAVGARERCMKVGADAYLAKPYDLETLQEMALALAQGGDSKGTDQEPEGMGFIPMEFDMMPLPGAADDEAAADAPPRDTAPEKAEEPASAGVMAPLALDLAVAPDFANDAEEDAKASAG